MLGKLIVISGFSGAGKGTIVNYLMEHFSNYALSISATSRTKRPGEEEGTHYFFVSKDQFEDMIAGGELLEYAKYNDNYYGTPKSFVLEQLSKGKSVILEIEINGALQVKEKFNDAVLIFITTPSYDDLCNRLSARGTETAQQINNRLKIAVNEASGVEKYDYIIVNNEVEKSATLVNGIVCEDKATIDELISTRQNTIDIIRTIENNIKTNIK